MLMAIEATFMTGDIRITSSERKMLTTGEKDNIPKYTFSSLNNAVKYSGANKKRVVGDISDIYEEFEKEYPDGDFEDWKKFYNSEYNGEERLDNATEKAFEMFLKIRAAIKQIDKDDVQNFVEGLVLNGTYTNRNPREAIAKKLDDILSADCEFIPSAEREGDEHIRVGTEPYKLIRTSNREECQSGNIIHFEEKSGGDITIDRSELSQDLTDFM